MDKRKKQMSFEVHLLFNCKIVLMFYKL